jgi:hypothetical protein
MILPYRPSFGSSSIFQADFDRAVQVKRGSYVGALGLSILYLCIVIAIAGLAKLLHWSFSAFMVSLGLLCAVKSFWLCILRVRPHWSWGLRLLTRDWHRHGMPSLIRPALLRVVNLFLSAYSTDRERGFHAIVNTAVGWAAGHRCFT